MLTPGTILQNRYQIIRSLGQGGMGAVYLAQDLRLARAVVVKENSSGDARQFQQEALLLANLSHSHLPRVTDHFVEANGAQYLVMDYVEGEDLESFVRRNGAIPETQALGWINQVLDAVSYLHRNHVIHRDIKPSNIKITPNGEAVLVDFGIAKRFVAGQQTMAGAQGFGSPGFASPEHYQGGTDARSDIYSLGATLYNVLTGRVPTDALGLASGSSVIVPPRALNPNISVPTERVVLRALLPQPPQRFQNAEEMRGALFPPKTEPAPTPPVLSDTNKLLQYALIGMGLLSLGLLLWLLSAVLGWINSSNQEFAQIRVALNTATPAPPVPPTPTATGVPATNTPTSTPLPPPPIPKGKIAYESAGRIFILSLEATIQSPTVTAAATRESGTATATPIIANFSGRFPAWSSDGSRIAYWEGRELRHRDANGQNERNLRVNSDQQDRLSWSPSGIIAFTKHNCCSHPPYSVAFALTFDENYESARTEFGFASPAFSPDGRYLAMVRRSESGILYVASGDGSNLRILSPAPSNDYPIWSPDSQRIAFRSNREGNSEIYIIDADGKNLKRLTDNDVEDDFPTWSPDGNFIAFQSRRNERWGIYVINVDGTGEQRITDDSADAIHPAWSPE